MHAGKAEAQQLGLRRQQRSALLGFVGCGHKTRHQIHGGIDQDSAGRTISTPLDAATLRVGGVAGDSGQRQRAAIGPTSMAIDPYQPDRAQRLCTIEFHGSRKAAELPVGLVPTPAPNPAGCGPRLGIRLDGG